MRRATLAKLFTRTDRYVFYEAFQLWLLGFFAFLAFLLINQMFLEWDALTRPNFPRIELIKVLFLRTPNYMTQAIPVATLFATLMSMGRLGKDNELTAFFTNGISLYRLFLPFFVLAMGSAVSAYVVNEYLVPPSNAAQDALKVRYPVLREEDEIEPNEPVILKLPTGAMLIARYMDKQAGKLYNVMIEQLGTTQDDPKAESKSEVLQTAKSSEVKDTFLYLSSPWTYQIDQKGNLVSARKSVQEKISIGLKLNQIYSTIRTPQELTREELMQQQQVKQQLGMNSSRDATDYWLKFAIPFASLAFALVAMPLSIRAPRDERLLGLILTFLLVLAYYIVSFITKLMGYSGALPPFIAAQTANIVFAVASAFILANSRK